ncbi:type 1 glutamine amidotransferase domain-containing protein [Streptomyces sp. H39-C1]|uniref:type 1 glutamine amidotransferase domain-containing protein n=1 Tax=Streptomyces sp. H39-C1 TaxID=3004355 RepID=UPI0022AE9944|nr:type 1 glutamine amidotransferase domain-containing protein [Streptomyces sp. H39-C1]MCZ4103022.1 type 1 glutamine amidotransferase domain-containing protein [Streptomyces sp. H39-C1]
MQINRDETKKRALFVLTSHTLLGSTGRSTGFHLGETAEPWAILDAAGIRVEFLTIDGAPAEMIGHDPDSEVQNTFLKNPEVQNKLSNPIPLALADATRYGAIYFVGGHGAMWDFRPSKELQELTRDIYEAGGVVSAICHGQAALVDVQRTDGHYLVSGKELTAFSHESEQERGLDRVVPFSLQHALQARGAIYSCASGRNAHVVRYGRLLTAQNPASAAGLGHQLADMMQQS